MTAGIVVAGLTKRFGDVAVIDGVDLAFEKGEITVILGPSGCGKTTLLRCIAGFETPDAGRIDIDGRAVFGAGREVPAEDRGIGIVFQSYALWPHMTVRQNVGFPLKMRGVFDAARLDRALRLVGLEHLADRAPRQLSGGQQQRVALARALVAEPATLLLDEPLANLDAKLRETMRGEIKRVQRETAVTTVHVTHDQVEALVLADRVVVMDHGRVMGQGAPRQMYQRPPNLFCARFIGELNEIPVRVTGGWAALGGQRVAAAGMRDGPAILAARPAETRLVDGGDLPGQVVGVAFHGDTQQVTVDLPAGRVIAIAGPKQEFSAGQPVFLSIAARDMMIFPAPDGTVEQESAA